ncbi:hypothetical protein LWI28_014726 [Acer negundo]|uniref:Uncharacterized protein n=1 Tax=Acer negundo TaxID=4023 RepID=A0AAD5JGK2_ACENE|nr:hypothetical protein LWI28_014726 [Acer negundo]KAK4858981.1 hypothetical protein QYF36_024835 [Acer negundo]
MKEKNELLDDGDDGDDRGDGDDGAPIGKILLRRNAPKQKEKPLVKKKQRKTVIITCLAEEDPLHSLYSPRYTSTPLEDLHQDIHLPLPKTLHQGIHLPLLKTCYTHLPHRIHLGHPLSNLPHQCHHDRNLNLRITDLLEAVKALPDLLEGVVKREVSQLPGVLRGLMQEIQSTCGQSNEEAPLTDVRDQSLYVEKEVDACVSTEHELTPSAEKEVAGSVLLSEDLRVGYNL